MYKHPIARLPDGKGLKHKVGFGSVFVVDANSFDGDLGRGTGLL